MLTVALIEDNADNRLLVCALLEDRYRVLEYADGRTGLEGLRRDPIDVVLLDISLPGMDGLELLAIIRQDRALRHLPVIALTAHAMAGDRERFLLAGFDDYCSKPILDEQVLIRAIEDCHRRRQPQSP